MMTSSTLKRIWNWLIPYFKKVDDPLLNLVGGEPLLSVSLLIELSSLLAAYNSSVKSPEKKIRLKEIPTNGLLLDKRMLNFLRSSGMRLAFSLDGYSYEANSHRFSDVKTFSKVLSNISAYKSLFGVPLIKMAVYPGKSKSLAYEVEQLINNGLTRIDIEPVVGFPWHKEEVAVFFETYKKILEFRSSCFAAGRKVSIGPIDRYREYIRMGYWDKIEGDCCGLGHEIVFTPRGDAYACTLANHLYNENFKKRFYLGNVFKKIDLRKMEGLENLHICDESKIECKHKFPNISCKKICSFFDLKTRDLLDIEFINNYHNIYNFMFHEAYRHFFQK